MAAFGLDPLPSFVDNWDDVANLYEIETPFERGDRVILPEGEQAYFLEEMKGLAKCQIIHDDHTAEIVYCPVKKLKRKEYRNDSL